MVIVKNKTLSLAKEIFSKTFNLNEAICNPFDTKYANLMTYEGV
jgi:hypothetical protein